MKRQELFLFVSSAANCQSCNTVLRLFLRGGFLCFVFIAKDLGYCFLEKMSVYSVLFSLFYKFSVILACWAVLTHSIGSTTFIKIRLHEMLKFNVLLLIVVWKTSWSEARNQKKSARSRPMKRTAQKFEFKFTVLSGLWPRPFPFGGTSVKLIYDFSV